jgi:hypothetical protein
MEFNRKALNSDLLLVDPLCRTYMVEAEFSNKTVIVDGVQQLWKMHCDLQISMMASRKQLQLVENTLGEALYSLKVVLAQAGRNGQWSVFLRQQRIPRTVADRLVLKFRGSLSPESSGEISPDWPHEKTSPVLISDGRWWHCPNCGPTHEVPSKHMDHSHGVKHPE